MYKGRWHGSDVAIKIINVRTPEELPKVLREAEVMMALEHPNIVRAFHASVWNPAEQVRAAAQQHVVPWSIFVGCACAGWLSMRVLTLQLHFLPSRIACCGTGGCMCEHRLPLGSIAQTP